jgi:hypothetical protein
MKRRTLLKGAAGAVLCWGEAESSPASQPIYPEARAVTRGPKCHFFGYYDKSPWDATGRYLLAMEVDFAGRDPKPGERLTVGMVDLRQENKYVPLDTTPAWCWQQGTMLQWLGSAPDREVIYNSLEDDHYISIIRDVQTGRMRKLPRPVYDVSMDGKQAVTLDFERVNRLRPGYGYVALPEKYRDDPAPKEAGIYWMDLATGENHQILSLDWAVHHQPLPDFQGAQHWFNHLKFNPSGSRFMFLHRWRTPGMRGFLTRLYTAAADGSNAHLLSRSVGVSHYDWRDDDTILIWTSTTEEGAHFYHINDRTGEYKVVAGGVLTRDGHCSYSPDRKWILVDAYPDQEGRQPLMLYRPADNKLIEIGRFPADPRLVKTSFRCDLHPRWNRDGTQVCIDSSHEPTRQMYVIDVGHITKG